MKIDPAGVEPRAIIEAVNFSGADVLEVGAGDGRLTRRYIEQVSSVVGIDTKEPEVRSAAKCSVRENRQSHFLCASGIHLPFPMKRSGSYCLDRHCDECHTGAWSMPCERRGEF